MPKTKNVEKKIAVVERFTVKLRKQNGPDLHGAKDGLPPYPYKNAAPNDMTVSGYKQNRFRQVYPGYEPAVLDGDGNEVNMGQTKLSSVRATYSPASAG